MAVLIHPQIGRPQLDGALEVLYIAVTQQLAIQGINTKLKNETTIRSTITDNDHVTLLCFDKVLCLHIYHVRDGRGTQSNP